MTNVLALLPHWSVRQKLNRVSSVTLLYARFYVVAYTPTYYV